MSNEKFILNMDGKLLSALRQQGYERDPNHKYILFTGKPITGFLTHAAKILTSFYLKEIRQTSKQWKKDNNNYRIKWQHPKTKETLESKNINYLLFTKTLKDDGEFEPLKFNLPSMECFWLDISLDLSINYHFFEDKNKEAVFVVDGTPQMQYGNKYPIIPKLDREGHIFTTFQPQLIKRIIRERKLLIENSENCLKPEWILDLRALINDSISLLEITLIQIYIKAKYAPEKGWNIFDKEKLGDRNNRRLKDKLHWVYQITGNNLDIDAELPKLNKLKTLRNHLNHFDPPTLVITLEEAVDWLNDIIYIGQILIKIRIALGVPISIHLINFIMQQEAIFNPEEAFTKRLPLIDGKTGYSTSIWKEKETGD